MSQTALDLMLTVTADEATLQEIKNKLINPNSDCTPVGDVLSVMVQQTLIAAGITDQFDVQFHCGQIKSRFVTGGGLNAQEWLEKGKPS